MLFLCLFDFQTNTILTDEFFHLSFHCREMLRTSILGMRRYYLINEKIPTTLGRFPMVGLNIQIS